MPARLTRPTLGLSPTMPLMEDGQTIEPSVSVPIAAGTIPAATATAEPELEPHGLRIASCALTVCPPTALHPDTDIVERKFAHSERFALPTITAPAARRCATRGASRPVTLFASASDPAVVGNAPAVSMLSFTRIGMP